MGTGAGDATAIAAPGAGQWFLVATLYAIGRFAFSSSIVMYDALLPHVTSPRSMDAVSARGYALGYLGGGVLLAAQILAIQNPSWFGLPSSAAASALKSPPLPSPPAISTSMPSTELTEATAAATFVALESLM